MHPKRKQNRTTKLKLKHRKTTNLHCKVCKPWESGNIRPYNQDTFCHILWCNQDTFCSTTLEQKKFADLFGHKRKLCLLPGWSQVSSAGRCRPGVLSGLNVGRDPTTGRGLPRRAGTERAGWVTRGVGFGRPCQGKRRESGRRRRTLSLVSVCVCACVSFCASRVGVAFAPLFSGKIQVLEETWTSTTSCWRNKEAKNKWRKERFRCGKRNCLLEMVMDFYVRKEVEWEREREWE